VDAKRRRHPGADDVHDLGDVVRQHPAVGVAQDEPLGAGLGRCLQHGQREGRVAPVAVEEVLGVEEDTTALPA
jgi:hypothetical protein